MGKKLFPATSEAIYQTISSSAHVEGTTSSTSKNPEVNYFSCAMANGQSCNQGLLAGQAPQQQSSLSSMGQNSEEDSMSNEEITIDGNPKVHFVDWEWLEKRYSNLDYHLGEVMYFLEMYLEEHEDSRFDAGTFDELYYDLDDIFERIRKGGAPMMLDTWEAARALGFHSSKELLDAEQKNGLFCDKYVVNNDPDKEPLIFYLNVDVYRAAEAMKRKNCMTKQSKSSPALNGIVGK